MCNKIIEAQLETTEDSKHVSTRIFGSYFVFQLKVMDKNESLSYINEYFLQSDRQQQEFDTAVGEGLEDGDAFKLPWGRNYT
jgi:hypothetical protein